MAAKPSTRLQEGALSARATPKTPPAQTKLVPIGQTTAPKAGAKAK